MAPTGTPAEEPTRDDVARLLDAARRGEIDSLDELAAQAHFSRFHLSRLLKKHLGFPLRDFLAAARVERSIDGLVDGHNVTRSQIDAGHDSPSSFHRAFRRHTGMAPAEYRKQMQSLAAFLMRQQNRHAPLVVLHRRFVAGEHRSAHPLTVQVSGAQPGSALFVALNPDPLVRDEPTLGIALLGTNTYSVDAIPAGTYYVIVVEVPRRSDVRAYFQMAGNRRQLRRVPIQFPLTERATVDLELRERIAEDPPITLNLPRLFAQAAKGQLDLEVSNSGQADGPATP